MLKRLAGTGLNILVLVISVAVFLVAFFMLNALGAAQRPPTVSVLSAARDLRIGDVIGADDLLVKTVFEDDNTTLYLREDETEGVIGGIVAQQVYAGQPVFRSSILAPAAEGTRLSAVLAEYPGYSLFPLPLDAMNMIAPDLTAFLPGDLVGITLVIANRPQQFSTPTALPVLLLPEDSPVQPEPTPSAVEAELAEAENRSAPPLAKDLFPEGVRIVSVQGIEPVSDTEGDSASYSTFDQPQMLILLLPNEAREVLSLALAQGDRLVVSLMARGEDSPTAGFTYWDFEDLFKIERQEALQGGR